MQVTRINPAMMSNYSTTNKMPQRNVNFTANPAPLMKKPVPKRSLAVTLFVMGTAITSAISSLFETKKRDLTEEEVDALKKYYVWAPEGKLGHLNLHAMGIDKIKGVNEVLKGNPKALAKVYLERDDVGKVPAAWADAAELREIDEALKDQPEVLKKMYLNQNVKGKTVAHTEDVAKLKEMHRALHDQPKLIEKIHLTEMKRGRLPIHYTDSDGLAEIMDELGDKPKVFLRLFKNPHKFLDQKILNDVAVVLEMVASDYPEKYQKKALELAEVYRHYND